MPKGNKQKNNNLANTLNKMLGGLVSGKSQSNKRRNGKRKPRQLAGAARVMETLAPVSMGVSSVNAARNNVARQMTTDYIATYDFNNLTDGQTIFEFRIEPSLFPTLSRFASSYQRIRFHQLFFQLSAHLPTNTTGGYVMGFRPDATDKLPDDPIARKQFVVGTPGSVKNSIWKSYAMRINQSDLTNRLLYTSPGDDPREFSPGTLFVVVDGAVNQPGSLSLSITYNVSCSIPSFESAIETGVSSNVVSAIDTFAYTGQTHLKIGDTSSSDAVTWEQLFPNFARPQENVYFEVEFQFGMHGGINTADVEWSRLLYYNTTENNFSPATPNGRFGNDVTFETPGTGNTQAFGAGTTFAASELQEHGTFNLNSQVRQLSPSKPAQIHSSNRGGMSNIRIYKPSFKPLIASRLLR